MKKPKMMIVVRTDLGMGVGKMIAQAGHAIVELTKYSGTNAWYNDWFAGGMKKVCVAVDSEDALLQTAVKAKELGIPCAITIDAGLTQNEPGTRTCCAIGPGKDKEIEKVTGHLKLLD